MGSITLDEFGQQLKRRAFHTAYLFVGPEVYLRRQAVRGLRSTILGPEECDLNWEEHDAGAGATAARIIEALSTLPLNSARRVVLVQDAQAFSAADQERLLAYLKSPNPRSVLILVAEELDRRTGFFKHLLQEAQVVEFAKLKGYALTAWAEDQFRQRGRTISRGLLARLVDLAGADLQMLASEIEKLVLYSGAEKVIQPQAVDQMIHGSRQHSIFELTAALGLRDRQAALRSLGNLLDAGEPALGVLGMMARHFRQVLIAQEMLKAHRPSREIAQAAQIPAFLLEEFLRQCRAIEAGVAEQIYIRLGEIDVRIKTTGAGERVLLESLIHALPEGRPMR